MNLPKHAHPIERKIARDLVSTVVGDGNTISVYDGVEYVLKRSSDIESILGAMSHAGQDHLFIRNPVKNERLGYVYFIFGNEPEYVIADWAEPADNHYIYDLVELVVPLEADYAFN